MGVKPGSRIRLTTADTGVVERVVSPAVARPEGDPMTIRECERCGQRFEGGTEEHRSPGGLLLCQDCYDTMNAGFREAVDAGAWGGGKESTPPDPLEMTKDKLVWLFSEETADYIDEHKGCGELFIEGFGYDLRDFVVAENILHDYDESDADIIANLRERFATYLVDDQDFDSDEAVEQAEELIDDDFLSAYRDEFIASLKQEAADRDLVYFDTHQEHHDNWLQVEALKRRYETRASWWRSNPGRPDEEFDAYYQQVLDEEERFGGRYGRIMAKLSGIDLQDAMDDTAKVECDTAEPIVPDPLEKLGYERTTVDPDTGEFVADERPLSAAQVAQHAKIAKLLGQASRNPKSPKVGKPVEVAQLLRDEDSLHDGEENLVDITELLGLPRDIEYVAPKPTTVALHPGGMDRATKRFLSNYAIPVMAEHGLNPLKFDSWEDFRDQFVEVSGEFLEMAGKDPYSAEFDVDYDEIAKRLWTGARVRNN